MGDQWTIYCHIHSSSGRRYVGLTKKTMLQRWNRHVYNALHSNGGRSHFANAIRKYGKDAFSHEVLEICDTLEAANVAEERWIKELGTRDPAKGFNLMRGGAHIPHLIRKNPWDDPVYRGVQMSRLKSDAWKARMNEPDTKAKMSAASNGRKMANNPWDNQDFRERGILHLIKRNADQSVRKRISEKLSGRKLSPEHVERSRVAGAASRLVSLELARKALLSKPKKTHCKNGHSLSDASVQSRVSKDGALLESRKCRECQRTANAKRRKEPAFRERQKVYNSRRSKTPVDMTI
jgi:hypothetical protein